MPMSISMLAASPPAISPPTLTKRKSSNRTRSDTTRTCHKLSPHRGDKDRRTRRPSSQMEGRWASWEIDGSSSGPPSDSGVRRFAKAKVQGRPY